MCIRDRYRNYRAYKKILKISKFYFGPGSPKNQFLRFFRKKITKKWAGNTGITSETTIPEISSETTIPGARYVAAATSGPASAPLTQMSRATSKAAEEPRATYRKFLEGEKPGFRRLTLGSWFPSSHS